MIIYLLVIALLIVWGIRIKPSGIFEDYISVDAIQPVKGVFIMLIFASHFVQYMKPSGVLFDSYYAFRSFLGQMVVTCFLFYSGYGIVYSIENKGKTYLFKLPFRRILKVLLQMMFAVLLFLIIQTLRGNQYSVKRILLCFIGWEGIGNSNWYIFAILILYIETFIIYIVFKSVKSAWPKILCLSIITGVFVYFMKSYKDDYWYNTVYAYVAGCAYYYAKYRVDTIVLKNDWIWFLSFVSVASVFSVLRGYWSYLIVYEISSAVFAFCVVLLTMKVRITNKILKYCGEHLFSIFSLHRIPMILLQKTQIGSSFGLYFSTCFIITIIISFIFDALFSMIWNSFLEFSNSVSNSSIDFNVIAGRLKQHHFLFEELVKRDFKKKYKRTIMGMAWSILSPLLTLLVMKLVFTQFFGRNTMHYTTYLFCGNLVFSFFNESTTQGMSSLMSNASIFTKVNVPKYLFLLSKNVQTLINFGLTLCVFFVFCIFDHITFTWRFILLIYPIVMLVLFNIGVGLILSALFIFFKDIQYLWSVFITLLMYLSAIFYTIDSYSEQIRKLFLLNPVYLFIRYFRKIVIDATIPTVWFHLLIFADVIIALSIGFGIYKKYNHQFLYYV